MVLRQREAMLMIILELLAFEESSFTEISDMSRQCTLKNIHGFCI